jgi:hypothetical protein
MTVVISLFGWAQPAGAISTGGGLMVIDGYFGGAVIPVAGAIGHPLQMVHTAVVEITSATVADAAVPLNCASVGGANDSVALGQGTVQTNCNGVTLLGDPVTIVCGVGAVSYLRVGAVFVFTGPCTLNGDNITWVYAGYGSLRPSLDGFVTEGAVAFVPPVL